MTLTIAEQRKIMRALPPKTKAALKKHCCACEQGGAGFFDVLKKAGSWLSKNVGPIAKEVGPTVMKEFVMPMLKKKVGLGLRPAGAGLRTVGGPRGRGKKKKKA